MNDARENDLKSLKWAISISRLDVASIAKGKKKKLLGELYDFTYPSFGHASFVEWASRAMGEPMAVSDKVTFLKAVDDKAIETLAADFKDFFFQLSQPGEIFFPVPNEEKAIPRLRLSNANDFGPFGFVFISGDIRTDAVIRLAHEVVHSRIVRGQVRACPECSIVFLIDRKPRTDRVYHWPLKCSRKAASRADRERRKMERQRNQKKYDKRLSNKIGPGRKIKLQSGRTVETPK